MIPSSKRIGKYEEDLLCLLNRYFEDRGYRTYPHVQLNISWGNIISDIDLILETGDTLFGIEVKSKKDDFRNVFRQIDRMSDFFDGIYVASDKSEWGLEKKLEDQGIGMLAISNGQIKETRCQIIRTKPRHSALMLLRKICLSRLSLSVNSKKAPDKRQLASDIAAVMDGEHLRLVLKSIVTCPRKCETSCPIWDFERRILLPLRNMQSIFRKYETRDRRPIPLVPADLNEKHEESTHKPKRDE